MNQPTAFTPAAGTSTPLPSDIPTPAARWATVTADPAWADPLAKGALTTDQKVQLLETETMARAIAARELQGDDYDMAMGMVDEWYRKERARLERDRAKHDAFVARGRPGAGDHLVAASKRVLAGIHQAIGAVDTAISIGLRRGAEAVDNLDPAWDPGLSETLAPDIAKQQAGARRDSVEIPEALIASIDPRLRERSSKTGQIIDATLQSAPHLVAAIAVTKGAAAVGGSRLAAVAPFLYTMAAEGQDAYYDTLAKLTEQGMSLSDAETQAVAAWLEKGTVGGALEAITPVMFLKHLDEASGGQIKKTLAKRLVSGGVSMARATITEGVTEFLQESWGQNVARRYFIDPKLSPEEREALITQWKVAREVASASGSLTGFLLDAVAKAAGVKGRVHIETDEKGKMRADLGGITDLENRLDLDAVARSGDPITESFISDDPRFQAARTRAEADTVRQVIAFERALRGQTDVEVEFRLHGEERTLQDEIDSGILNEEEAWQRIKNADGLADSIASPADVRVFGKNSVEFAGNVYRQVVDLYHGATPQDVVEEMAEAWFKTGVSSGRLNLADFQAIKADYDSAHDGPVHTDDLVGVTEWFSSRAGEYLTHRTRQGGDAGQVAEAFGAWLERVTQRPEAGTAAEARTFFQRARLALSHTLRRARQLLAMTRGGQLDPAFEDALAAATGLSVAQITATEQSEAALARATAPPPQTAKEAEASLLAAQAEINRSLDIQPPKDPGLTQSEQALLKETVAKLTPKEKETLRNLVNTPADQRHQFIRDNKVTDRTLFAFDALIPEDPRIQDELLARVRRQEVAEYQAASRAQMFTLNEAIRRIGGLLTPSRARESGETLAGEMERIQKESRKIPGRFRNTGRPYDEAVLALREYGFDFADARDLVNALHQSDAGQEVMGTMSSTVGTVTFSLADGRPLVPPVPHGRLVTALRVLDVESLSVAEARQLFEEHTTPTERAWLGANLWLSSLSGSVTRGDLGAFVDEACLPVTESTPLGPTAGPHTLTLALPAFGLPDPAAATLATVSVEPTGNLLVVRSIHPGRLQTSTADTLPRRLLCWAASRGFDGIALEPSILSDAGQTTAYVTALGGQVIQNPGTGLVELTAGAEARAASAGITPDPVPVTYSIREADVAKALEEQLTAAQVAASRRRLERLGHHLNTRAGNPRPLKASEREQLRQDIRTLEGIVAELPLSIRGQLGGFSSLAKLVRITTRQRYLLGRVERALQLLTAYEREAHLANIDALLSAAETRIAGTERTDAGLRGTGEGSRKEKGRLGGEGHRLFSMVGRALALRPESVETRLAELEGLMAQDLPDSDMAAHFDEWDILHHVGAIRNKSVDELARAETFLQHLFDTQRTRRRVLEEARRARWQDGRADLRNATGKPFATENEVAAASSDSQRNPLAKADAWMAQKLDFAQFLERMFPGSTWARSLGDRCRAAVNQTTDRTLQHQRAYSAFCRDVLGVTSERAMNHRLAQLMERRKDSNLYYYERHGRTEAIPLDHAAAIARGEDKGYPGHEAAIIAAAYQAHEAEGRRLWEEARRTAADRQAKVAQAKSVASNPEERLNKLAGIDMAAPVLLEGGSLIAGGFRPYPGRPGAAADFAVIAAMDELSDTYEGAVGWQHAPEGGPRLYHRDGQAYAVFLRHEPGAVDIDAVLFPVTLEGGFNLGDETKPETTPSGETPAAQPPPEPTSVALAGWKRRKNVTVEFPGTGRVEQEISQMEAAYDWLLLRQEEYAARREQLGFPPDAMEQLEAFLLPETKALALYMQRELDGLYEHINPVYERLNGTYLARHPNYFPGIFETAKNQDSQLDPFAPDHAISALRDGFTKRRILHSARRRRVSAFHVFFAHLQAAEHYAAFAEIAADMRATMLDPAVQNSLVAARGAQARASLQNWLKLIEGGGSISAELHLAEYDVFTWLSSNLARAALAWKATTTLVQTSNVFATLAGIPSGQWLAAATRLAVSGRFGAVLLKVWQSPDIQRRLASGFSPEMKLLLSPANPRKAHWLDSLSDAGLDIINRTDAGGLAVSGAIAYDWALHRATKAGLSPAAAHVQAMAETSRIIQRVQQPTDFINKSLTENAKNPVMKMGLLMFLSDPRRKVSNLYMAAWKAAQDYQARPGLKTALAGMAPAGRLAVLYFLIFPFWESVARGLAKVVFGGEAAEDAFDEKEILANMAVGPLTGLPIVGLGWELAVRECLDLPTFSRNPLLDSFFGAHKTFTRDRERVFSALQEEDYLEAIEQLGKAVNHIGAATWGSLGALGTLIFQSANAVRFADQFLPLTADERALAVLDELKTQQDTVKAAAPRKAFAKPLLSPIERILADLEVGRKANGAWTNTRRADGIKVYLEGFLEKDQWAATLRKWEALEFEPGRKLISRDVRRQLEERYGFVFPE